MRYIPKKKLRVVMIIFMAAGSFGIAAGLLNMNLFITLMGVSQLCIGGFIGWMYLTQAPQAKDRRRRR